MNRDAMRTIKAPPKMIPIPILQEHAQPNTLTELVEQRETTRQLKKRHTPAIKALHMFPDEVECKPNAEQDIPPWLYTTITTNKMNVLHRSKRGNIWNQKNNYRKVHASSIRTQRQMTRVRVRSSRSPCTQKCRADRNLKQTTQA